MKLGQITGWDIINEEAKKVRREENRRRKEKFEKEKRRRELDAAGFRPVSSREYGADSCAVGWPQ